MPQCSSCRQQKPLDAFGRDRQKKSGYLAACKSCRNASYNDRYMANLIEQRKRKLLNTTRWYAANKIKHLRQKRTYYACHLDQSRIQHKLYAKAHPGKIAEKTRRRNATKKKAYPKWANQFFISEIYGLAALRTRVTGIKWHVDHIVPLKNSLVCGLHCESNLQVIPARYNMSKGNRFSPEA